MKFNQLHNEICNELALYFSIRNNKPLRCESIQPDHSEQNGVMYPKISEYQVETDTLTDTFQVKNLYPSEGETDGDQTPYLEYDFDNECLINNGPITTSNFS